jgi:hypothetical protein
MSGRSNRIDESRIAKISHRKFTDRSYSRCTKEEATCFDTTTHSFILLVEVGEDQLSSFSGILQVLF